nr:DUF349 domain-containing protein [Kofleriaceae bacterium]
MGIADLFRPKYRHSDVRVRTEAVRALTSDDVAILTQVAKTDRDIGVRRLAIEKLDEAEIVAEIAAAETERSLRELATTRAAQLWTVAACSDDADAAGSALAGMIKLGDQHALVDVAVRAATPVVRKRAFGELRDPRALADLAKSDAPQDVRVAAVGRIDDGDVLRALAIDTTTKEVGLAAVDKLDDNDRLENVAQKAKNKAVRQRARKIVTEMEEAERAAKPSVSDDVKRRRAEKAQLIREVEAVAETFDFAKSALIVKRAEDAWSKLAADDRSGTAGPRGGDHDGDDRFTKAAQRFWKRRELHDEQARTADELRAVQREAERERERVAQHKMAEAQAVETAGPQAAATGSATAAAPAVPAEKSEAELAEAKARRDERDARKKADDERRAAEIADREARRKEDAERGVAIAASLGAMIDDMDKLAGEPGGRGIDRLLQQAARAFEGIAKVPAEQRAGLADRYTAARGKLVTKLGEAREAEDWERWQNVPKAEALIATAKQFLDEEASPDLGNRLRQLQALWKEVGPMPQRRSKELWDQFKAACDQVYDKVKGFRAVETERFGEVAVLKEALITEAESLADLEVTADTAARLKELQAKWKESGHLPRKQGDELWKRFRAACDRFFERRKPMLDAQRAEEDANLARKLELIARAREVVAGAPGDGGWGRAIGQIKDVQQAWKEIGYVPRRDADRVYREFRAACDALFALRDQARDGEATAHRDHIEAVRAEIAAVTAGGDGDGVVARAIAARAKAVELGGFGDDIEAMVRHVVAAHPAAVAGTELDPAAARARRAKLIARAEELLPKAAAVSADAGDVAAQLKNAMRANAFGSLRFSGRDPIEVVDELRAAWREAGPVLDDEDRAQAAAFDDMCKRALAASGRDGRESRGEGRDREARGEGREDGRRRRRDRDRRDDDRGPRSEPAHAAPAAAPAVAAVSAATVSAAVVTPAPAEVTAPASPPPVAIAEPAPKPESAAPPAPTIPSTEVTAPLGLAGIQQVASAPIAPAPAAPAPASTPAPAAEPPPATPRTKTLTQPPVMDELDTGWDLGDDDPTAATPSGLHAAIPESESPPSASEMAGDGATGGDGIADDPGWD